jgi:curli biogenesis system outer membrane secretion channel CsgG
VRKFPAILVFMTITVFAMLAGCATESHHTLEVQHVAAANTPYSGPKVAISVGKFDNRSSYMRGLFSDGVDRLGGQAKTILIAHLNQTGRFRVLDRDNMQETAQEAYIKKQKQTLQGADYVITGNVAEFGRKEVGDMQLFGILGRGKKQVAYTQVVLNVVDVQTSGIVYSVQGAGEEHRLALWTLSSSI